MKIQPVHYVWENTPLKYYKFACVLSVIGLMASLGFLISWREEEYRHWLDLTYNIVRSLVFAFSAWNLIKRRWSGAVAWCLSYLIWTIYAAAVCILYYIKGISFYELIPQIIVSVLAFFATWIYFFKRRPLFFPWNGDSAHSTIPSTNDSMSSTSWDVSPDEVDSLVAEIDEITRNAPKDTSSVPTSNGPEKPRFDFKKASDLLNHRPISSQETIYRCCPQCGQLIPYIQNRCDCGYQFSSHISFTSKLFSRPIFLSVCSVLSVVTLSLCVALFFSISNTRDVTSKLNTLQTEHDTLSRSLSAAKSRIEQLNERIEDDDAKIQSLLELNELLLDSNIDASFYYQTIGFIVNGSSYYHSFDCPIFKDASEYWAHNVEYCEYIGYQKCPNCFSNPNYS